MSWEEYALARQLLAEERVGTRVRASAHDEDEAFAATADQLKRRRLREG